MTQIIQEDGKTIIKTDKRIDTMNAPQFEKDIEPVLTQPGINLEMDCTELVYMATAHHSEDYAGGDDEEGEVQDDQRQPRHL